MFFFNQSECFSICCSFLPSLDEIMKYDIPAVIDYILTTTRRPRLYYVGHSLGCAMLFGATNHYPEINNKVLDEILTWIIDYKGT